MYKIYAISNQKGGVGKTTLKFNFPQNKRGVSRIVMYKVKVSGGLEHEQHRHNDG